MSAAVLAAGLVVTGCSPVKMGAAAITGSERITIATLDTQVTNLSEASKHIPASFQLSAAQQTQQTLTWLVRFQINEELARQAGITVTTAQADKALAEIYAAAKSEAEARSSCAPGGTGGSSPGSGSHTTTPSAASGSGPGSSATWYVIPASSSAGSCG